ncbi:MAG: glycosyltransferase [Pirellulales bacterium]|nr:glycosyltransferase [Pirellulales bacterium]
MDISICVANYNGDGVLVACLQSVLSQETDAEFEVIVHDDASTDDSLDEALERFPIIDAIRSPENVGYCTANHRMAEQACGEYLLLLNNDVELLDGAIQTLFRATRDDSDSILSLAEYKTTGELNCRGMGLDIFFTPFHCTKARHKVVYAMGACLMIRRDLWQQLGGYPNSFVYTAEDLYICLKARGLGMRTRILSESGYRHHVSRSTNVNGISLERRRFSERNRLYILENLVKPVERIPLWPLSRFMFYAEMLVHALRRRSLTPLKPLKRLRGKEAGKVSVLPRLTWRATKLMYYWRARR